MCTKQGLGELGEEKGGMKREGGRGDVNQRSGIERVGILAREMGLGRGWAFWGGRWHGPSSTCTFHIFYSKNDMANLTCSLAISRV